MSFLEELNWREMLHQTTASREAVAAHLRQPRVGYCGFDPTGDSLTIGNFVPIKLLAHFQRAGHTPVVLVGGGTGLIGDPSGKDAERSMQTRQQVEENAARVATIFERFLDFDPKRKNRARIVNNADWLARLSYLEVLRDVGKHFSVNAMIQRDSVRLRLENREQGISYTEFSYMLLQAYDFLHLKRELGCTMQLAGSDQYGNVVSGVDLIHHVLGREGEAGEAFGVTAPLLTRADGKKFGKTESGALWLSADRTSPYALYQYFINADDSEVVSMLRWLTFLDQQAIEALANEHQQAPHERKAQRALAREMTRVVHGEAELQRVEAASEALFCSDVRALDEAMLAEVFADVPHSEHDRTLLDGDGLPVVELLPQTTLASSKREARQFLASGAVAVNGDKAAADTRLTRKDLLAGARILLRRGKKHWHATRWP